MSYGDDIIVTTTPAIEGRPVRQYLGIVTGEAILGANIFRDLFASVRDIVGGRSAAYEEELNRAREIALYEIADVTLFDDVEPLVFHQSRYRSIHADTDPAG